jgi:lambda family phage minor tail protein L
MVIETGDLTGATVTRIRTFKKFLDGQPDADPDAHFEPDIYRVDRKSAHIPGVSVEFELASIIDQRGRELPAYVCMRDYCPLIYRRWTGTEFDYSKATCPYVGFDGNPPATAGAFFRRDGTSTVNPAEDKCGKRLSDCVDRFGDRPLPYGGFPGMALAPRQ